MTYNDAYSLSRPFTPRSFFMPGTQDEETAEIIYSGAAKNLHGESVPAARIQRLDYTHEGRKLRAEVGQPESRGEGPVMAIYGPSSLRNLYYVVTLNRGMYAADPIMVGSNEVNRVYEFLVD
ncbi:hypothetical protein ACHMXB_22555 (plasmid) [Arthrobacter sp. UC242_113]|uniref:hypothetical protein n=1 Tax=Arthrobacter sp. UC242_113 TaxID=3374550 RepID=UPI0037569941